MKTPLAFLAGILSGLILGAGAMLIAFPFLFPPPELDEPPPPGLALTLPAAPGPARLAVSAQAAPNRLSGGVFDRTAPGRDALHWADGAVGLYRQGDRLVLRLESDFVAGPGPDFYLYLNTRKIGDERDFLADPGRVKLTRLRAFRGGQNYILPAGIDLAAIRSVTVWCERFSEFIGNAMLEGPRS